MVHAATFGHVDFSSCDGTAGWWVGTGLRLNAVEDSLYLKSLELKALRKSAMQAIATSDLGYDAEWRQKYAIDEVERYQKASMPWLGAAKAQNDHNEAMDAMTAWYSVFGKEYGLL